MEYNVYIKKQSKHVDVDFTIHHLKCSNNLLEVSILYAVFVLDKYALIKNFRSPDQFTTSIDLLSIRISIRIINTRICSQSKHSYTQVQR